MRTRTHKPRVIDISTCLNYFESIYSYTSTGFGSRANHILRRFAIGTTISLQMLWQFDHQVVRTLAVCVANQRGGLRKFTVTTT
jgi:hypothetical protein